MHIMRWEEVSYEKLENEPKPLQIKTSFFPHFARMTQIQFSKKIYIYVNKVTLLIFDIF